MTREELYTSLGTKAQAAHERAGVLEKLKDGVQRVFDPSMWLAFISGVVEIFRGCRNPETAKSHVKEGSAVAYRSALQLARERGYRGKERRDVAWELVQEGKGLTDEELEGIANDAKDIPQPPPVEGGFWPVWVIAFLLLIPSASYSQERGFWPIDEVQNKRLDALESSVNNLENLVRSKPLLEAPSVIPKALPSSTVDNLRPSVPNALASSSRRLTSSELRAVARSYNGPTVGVYGMTVHYHLMEGRHGFSREQLEGLSHNELMAIHSAHHYGKVSPTTRGTVAASHHQAVVVQRTVQAVIPAQTYTYSYSTNCPNGICPTPPRSVRRLFGRR